MSWLCMGLHGVVGIGVHVNGGQMGGEILRRG